MDHTTESNANDNSRTRCYTGCRIRSTNLGDLDLIRPFKMLNHQRFKSAVEKHQSTIGEKETEAFYSTKCNDIFVFNPFSTKTRLGKFQVNPFQIITHIFFSEKTPRISQPNDLSSFTEQFCIVQEVSWSFNYSRR